VRHQPAGPAHAAGAAGRAARVFDKLGIASRGELIRIELDEQPEAPSLA
jgi:hypothetical protein